MLVLFNEVMGQKDEKLGPEGSKLNSGHPNLGLCGPTEGKKDPMEGLCGPTEG